MLTLCCVCTWTYIYDNDEGSYSQTCSDHGAADYECVTLLSFLLSCLSVLNSVVVGLSCGVTGYDACCPSSLQVDTAMVLCGMLRSTVVSSYIHTMLVWYM